MHARRTSSPAALRARPVLVLIGLVLLLAACNPAGSARGPIPTATPLPPTPTPRPQPTAPPLGMALQVAAPDGRAVGQAVDGNALRLTALLSAPLATGREVSFALQGGPAIARCTVSAGGTSCSVAIRADGWAW